MKRRRFLSLAAAFCAAPARGDPLHGSATWTGRAMGGEVSVILYGTQRIVDSLIQRAPEYLEDVENRFSLYRAHSALSRLNRHSHLQDQAELLGILHLADKAHSLTGKLFDPTVQPLLAALANGGNFAQARQHVGWHWVDFKGRSGVQIRPGMALTLNGIAQGFAADLIRGHFRRTGVQSALINVGEPIAIEGPFRLALTDPTHGDVGQRTITNRAIATSSPDALMLGETGHIQAPDGRAPLWSTVSIEANSAAMADALSTAAVFMNLKRLQRLKHEAHLHRITVVTSDGDLRSI